MSIQTAPEIPYSALVGRVLAFHRDRLDLHQNVLAHALGISQSAYSRIELGKSSLTVAQLRVVAQQLGRSSSQITHEVDSWADQLEAQGVVITDEKDVTKAALLIGLGILAALIAASNT